MTPSSDDQNIVNSLSEIRHAQSQLAAAVDTLTAAIDMPQPPGSTSMPAVLNRDRSLGQNDPGETGLEPQNSSLLAQKSGFTSRIVLTPDFTNTEPAANIGPFAQWGDKKKIVAMDPWGHLTPWQYKDIMEKENSSVPDGKVCLNKQGELAVTKFAVEPVWYLPGVAERFGIGERMHSIM
ncbi:Uracil-regulated protein 1 [Beauveria bassiana]|uniref:Uracil-regulated protein 1 n=1 Tax=Beauveria bassiana TaxID=176275 RepID=A0A2N6NLA9_BEABA|nr:Uracil-regulated protein 1 [Beauveria bassiana]